MTGFRVHQLRYDETNGAFEGRVDIPREGAPFRYPCHIHGPQDRSMDAVESGLLARATAMSDTVRR